MGTEIFFLPLRNDSSINDKKHEVLPPAFFINSSAAFAVPPVARRSSTKRETFLSFTSMFISKVSFPYSSSYS